MYTNPAIYGSIYAVYDSIYTICGIIYTLYGSTHTNRAMYGSTYTTSRAGPGRARAEECLRPTTRPASIYTSFSV